MKHECSRAHPETRKRLHAKACLAGPGPVRRCGAAGPEMGRTSPSGRRSFGSQEMTRIAGNGGTRTWSLPFQLYSCRFQAGAGASQSRVEQTSFPLSTCCDFQLIAWSLRVVISIAHKPGLLHARRGWHRIVVRNSLGRIVATNSGVRWVLQSLRVSTSAHVRKTLMAEATPPSWSFCQETSC